MIFDYPYIDDMKKEVMVKQVIRLTQPFLYKKFKTKVKVFCPDCCEHKDLSYEEFKQIRYSMICPNCHKIIHKMVDENRKSYKQVTYEFFAANNHDGVQVKCKYVFGKEPKLISINHVYHEESNKRGNLNYFVKGIQLYGMGYPMHMAETSGTEWRKTRGSYRYYFYQVFPINKLDKKSYLNQWGKFIEKSNQKKMVIDYEFNPKQLVAIKMFDLKSPDIVYKYRRWIRENISEIQNPQERYNEFTLRYLAKNNIALSLYDDYADMCQTLNRKLDKPKDFTLWHDRLNVMIDIKNNPEFVAKASKRYKKLSKHNFKKKNIEIKAFESYEEICDVSHRLHNCMSRLYVEPYCKGKTDLFHLDVAGVPTLAIEVNKGKLKQCYGDHNCLPESNLKKIVNKWVLSYE